MSTEAHRAHARPRLPASPLPPAFSRRYSCRYRCASKSAAVQAITVSELTDAVRVAYTGDSAAAAPSSPAVAPSGAALCNSCTPYG